MKPELSRQTNPDNKDHGANMGPTWVLSVGPGGPHADPKNLAIREATSMPTDQVRHQPYIRG